MPRSGDLHVIKECSEYAGLPGQFCTITSSNLEEIVVGARVIYAEAPGESSLDTDVTLDAGFGNTAAGHVVLDLASDKGTVTFRAVPVRLPDSGERRFTDAGGKLHWDGTYSFDERSTQEPRRVGARGAEHQRFVFICPSLWCPPAAGVRSSSRSICSGVSSTPICGTVLLHECGPFRPRDRHDVVALGQHPGEGDLRGRRTDFRGDAATSSAIRRFRSKFSPMKRGLVLRESSSAKSSVERISPVRKPRPSGE